MVAVVSARDAALRTVAKRWSFRAIHVGWREHLETVRHLREVLARPIPPPRPEADVCVVLPSYRRPDNLAVSARLALAAPSVRQVVVVDDDPSAGLGSRLGFDDPRLRLVEHRARVGPVGRYLAARDASDLRWLVSLDDDLWLPPEGLERLAAALRADPRVPHGFYGQRAGSESRFDDNLARFAGRVDVLNRVYAFTRDHLARYFALLDALGIDLDDREATIALDDDIVLSFCGEDRPLVHDVGPWLDCPSERRRGLARWRRPGAERARRGLYDALERVAPRGPAGYLPPRQPRPAPRTPGLAALEALSGVALLRGAWHRWRSPR